MVIIPEEGDLIAIRAVIQRQGAIPHRKVTPPRGVAILPLEAIHLRQATIRLRVQAAGRQEAVEAAAEVVVVRVVQEEDGNYHET